MTDDDRKARLAQALRQNLRRRKGQARDGTDADAPLQSTTEASVPND